MFIRALSNVTKLKIIITLRNQCEFLNSYYKQCVINPRNANYLYGYEGSIEEFYKHDRVRKILDYEKLVNGYCDIVGKNNVVVVSNYENNIEYFMNILGVKNNADFKVFNAKNLSLSDDAIDVIRESNSFLDIETKNKIIDIMKTKASFTQKATGMSQSKVNELIKEDYIQSNARLINLYHNLEKELMFN